MKLILLIFGGIPIFCLAQEIKGVKVINKNFSKHFIILLKDSISYENRFTNIDQIYSNGKTPNQNDRDNVYYLPFVTLDTDLLQRVGWDILKKSKNTYLSGIYGNLRKYIWLCAGFINQYNELVIIIQFIIPREYRKDKDYSYKFNLLVKVGAKKGNPKIGTIHYP